MSKEEKPTLNHVISLRITDDEREVIDSVRRKKKMSVSTIMREAFLLVLSQTQTAPPAKVMTVRRPRRNCCACMNEARNV